MEMSLYTRKEVPYSADITRSGNRQQIGALGTDNRPELAQK